MRTRLSSNKQSRSLGKIFVSALAGVGLVAGGLALPGTFAAADTIEGDEFYCMPEEGFEGGLAGDIRFVDNSVNTFVGGNARFNNSEVEGLTVVNGNAAINHNEGAGGLFNIGWVGVGSGNVPGHNELMLAVGGNLTLENETKAQVGKKDFREGVYQVAGWTEAAPEKIIDTGIFNPTHDLTGTAAEGFGAKLAAQSAAFAAATPTGEVVPGSGGWDPVKFIGDGTSNLQVFEVNAADLAGVYALDFSNVPATAAIVLNVRGSQVKLSNEHAITMDGAPVTYETRAWTAFTQRLMWHFVDASDVEMYKEGWNGGPANGQFTGSITMGNADSTLRIYTSINGRVHTNGDLEVRGAGMEIHSFPWNGTAASSITGTDLTTCSPVPGPVVVEPVEDEIVDEDGTDEDEVVDEDADKDGTEEDGADEDGTDEDEVVDEDADKDGTEEDGADEDENGTNKDEELSEPTIPLTGDDDGQELPETTGGNATAGSTLAKTGAIDAGLFAGLGLLLILGGAAMIGLRKRDA